MDSTTLRLEPTAPFDFDLTAGYHTYFQGRSGADNLDNGVYRRLLDLGGKLALASVSSVGNVDVPGLELELRGEALTEADSKFAADQVEWMLGTGQDLAQFYSLAGSDPEMEGLVRQFRGLHLPRTETLFESLVLAILGQQISAGVARTMRMLLIERYGVRAEFDGADISCLSEARGNCRVQPRGAPPSQVDPAEG